MVKSKFKDENCIWNAASSIVFILLTTILIILTVFFGRANTPDTLQFIIMGIATFRLIHLFYKDMVMDFVRDYFKKFEKGLGLTIKKLLSCPWCIGIWMALFIGYLYYLVPYSFIFIIIIALAGIGTLIEITAGLLQRTK